MNFLTILFGGLWVSLLIFTLTLVFSIPLGCAVTCLEIKRIPVVRQVISLYISVMRGTPLMLQLIFFYFLPAYAFGINQNRFVSLIITFSVNYAAYFAEIFRSGYISVPAGQHEASKVLGFSRRFTFFRIIVPQVAKRIMPAFSGEVITLIKDTALASTLGIMELFTIAQKTSSRLFSPMPIFVAGVFYFVLNFLIDVFFRNVEKRMGKYTI